MTFKAGDTLADYPDSSDGNLAHACLPANILQEPCSQHCPPPSLEPWQGMGLGRCGLGVFPDHGLIHTAVPKPALPGLISWAVAVRNCGCIWRGWYLQGWGWQKEPQHHYRPEGSNLHRGTQTQLQPPSSICSLPDHPVVLLSPSLPPCNNYSFPYKFGPLLAPSLTGFLPAISSHSMAGPPQPAGPPGIAPCPESGHGPSVRSGTTQHSLLGSQEVPAGRERQGGLRWVFLPVFFAILCDGNRP